MNLFFRSFGTGPVLIILHGLFGISDNWVTLGKQLGKGLRVIIPDLRNHGRSPHSDRFDFASMEQDILELIEEETVGAVMLLGHSLGGRVAVNLAVHHPEMIQKLVIVDISLRKYPPRREHLDLIDAMHALDLSQSVRRTELEMHLRQRISSQKVRQFLLKNLYWNESGKLAWRLNLPVISESLPGIFDGGVVTGRYTGPALFLRGERSDYIQDIDLPAIYDTFPGATVRTIRGATHWVHADNPGEFYQVVSPFLLGDQ
ncbi:MAG: alpha/beta fold hydrolase [Bacteroidales bacterium]|nr:alpha/beta fold hydrolase [Bacteroidales bacterium]